MTHGAFGGKIVCWNVSSEFHCMFIDVWELDILNWSQLGHFFVFWFSSILDLSFQGFAKSLHQHFESPKQNYAILAYLSLYFHHNWRFGAKKCSNPTLTSSVLIYNNIGESWIAVSSCHPPVDHLLLVNSVLNFSDIILC